MNKKSCFYFSLIILFLNPFKAGAQKFIFFLHNRFVEEAGINGVHPEYDHIEYDAILKAFRDGGFIVYSDVRPRGADANLYARKVAGQIDSLIKKGVKPSQITVIGTSKGGYIAQYVSGNMKNPELNFVFIGSCLDEDAGLPGVNFCGNILSIYEKTDEMGQSCAKSKQNSTLNTLHYKEIELNTGLRHGYLYKALNSWLRPAMQWASGNYTLTDTSSKKDLGGRIDSFIDAKTDQPFNGVILISRNGVTRYARSKGFSNSEKKEVLKVNDQFVIGSISKQITATLVLREMDKGRLSLDLPLRFYLPMLKQKWADSVTVHQLLTHTHGITDTLAPLAFRPGERFMYSQVGYYLLDRIVEKTSGKPFAVLSDELFRSFKMTHSAHPALGQFPSLLKSYSGNGKMTLQQDTSEKTYVAAGGFISSIYDLLLWNQLLHGGKLLSDKAYKLMTAHHADREHPVIGSARYGYGIMTSEKDSLLQVGHTGYNNGFASLNFYFPASGTSVIVLSNIDWHKEDIKNTFAHHNFILETVRRELLDNQ